MSSLFGSDQIILHTDAEDYVWVLSGLRYTLRSAAR